MGQRPGTLRRSPLVEIEASISLQRDNVLDADNSVAREADIVADAVGRNVELRLVSVDKDPVTLLGKRSNKAEIEGWVFTHTSVIAADEGEKLYRATFKVPEDFGVPGAVLVVSHHPFHFFLSSITLHLPPAISPNTRQLHFPCNSWVYNHHIYGGDTPRIFFTNQVYFLHQTPEGILDLRYSALKQLRGDGKGKRWRHDRIYDYDVYNDLGDPDKDKQLYTRTILGGSKEFPYPRRCRTGREKTETDSSAERPVELLELVYVPRDERFQRIKKSHFLGSSIKSFAHGTLTVLERLIEGKKIFEHIDEVKELYSKGVGIDVAAIAPPLSDRDRQEGLKTVFELAREIIDPSTGDAHFLKFPVPQLIQDNDDAWLQDDEFARQMLAGLNPVVIQRLTAFPIESKLDPNVYGPPTSSITSYDLEKNMNGLSVAEAIQQNRLYVLDYHDVFLPYIEKINALDAKAYASRTVVFLTERGTLKLLAIELSLPPTSNANNPQKLNRVFTPPHDPHEKDHNRWQLAKAHVSINDAGYHQLISHWLRTHASIEPFIIATHRRLSVMHPLHVLLAPHFKNTMNINAIARKILINSYTGQFLIGGIIERTFFPGRYSMEMSSIVYRSWRFDEQGLPADLLKRGMAVEDPTSKYGLRLLIEDYPFAVDGLEIWWAIKEWVRDYLNIFYKSDGEELKKDAELKNWWNEVLTHGHGDKKEGWINVLQGVEELGEAITTLIWLASAHHAAVNFGQYAYAGFMPNKPTTGRKLIPLDDEEDDVNVLSSTSTKIQTIIVIAILEILSTHAPDEEYLGDRAPHWIANELAVKAFERFKAQLLVIENNIVARNNDPELHNRHGCVKVPYTLLSPFSPEGLTGRGIPNSTSI